jgi:hypothetical protein
MKLRHNVTIFDASSRVQPTRLRWRALALATAFFGTTSIAYADLIQISATSFALRTSAGSTDVVGEGGAGLLQNAQGSYFAAVAFPPSGHVCRFDLVYRDFDNGAQITARLMKKKVAIGGSAFTPPLTMATLQTGVAAANDGVLRKATNVITEPTIAGPGAAFYFVQLDVPATTLQVLGVEILHKPTCP